MAAKLLNRNVCPTVATGGKLDMTRTAQFGASLIDCLPSWLLRKLDLTR
jgi:hypothetical protein